MNILQIIPNLKKGGAERLVIDIVRSLSKISGINIQLILLENKIEYDIKDIQELVHIITSDVKYSLRKKNRLEIEKLQKFINDFEPNIINTHLFKAELISRACFFPDAKWFSHCHSNMHQFKNFKFKTITKKNYLIEYYEKKQLFKLYDKNKGNHFIAISNDTYTFFKKRANKYNISVLLNAIDYNRFYKPINRSKKELLRLINVGSFQHKKNQLLLIEVANILKLKNIGFELILLGDGENRLLIEKKIKEYDLNSFISLKGNVDNVEDYLWESDIYVHSATYEAFGLVLIEAMAAGLPVITLDGKGNRDFIEQNQNGFMIFENNPEIFANAIIKLWNNQNDYKRISVYAQEYAKQFDIGNYCQKLLEIYKKY